MKVSFFAVFHGAVASGDQSAGVSCAADETSLLQASAGVRKITEHRGNTMAPGQSHYVGCFVDDPQRDLGQMVGNTNNAATNTFAGCRAACGDSRYMSLQYGGECFCADSYGNGAQYVQVSDSECNKNREPCSSNSHNCGGTWRQAIYEINPGKDHYVGCFVDDPQRDLGQMVGNTNNAATNTFAGCRAACSNSRYMSLQYGGECFCADSYGNGAQYVQVSDSECNNNREPCSAHSFNCGGTWRQAIYEVNPAESQCTGSYQAEDATISGGVPSTNHAGFTGSSFVNYVNPNDDFVEWTVDSCNGGTASLSFRYALAHGNRPLEVKVNGETVERRLSFPATGSWATWGLASVEVELDAGVNVVQLKATGSSGANMDSLIITPGIAGFGPGNVGACRDAEDHHGLYTRADHVNSVTECARACDANPNCVAIEFTGVTGGNKGCEMHTVPMPRATGHPNGLCYNKM